MKIVLCANTSWYIYNFRKNLIAEIQNRGHEVYAISPLDSHTAKLQTLGVKWSHIDLHPTSKNFFTEIRAIIQLLCLVKKLQPDFLLTFTIKCNLYAGLVRKVNKFAQIANISGLGEVFDHKNRIIKTLACHLYRNALGQSQKVFFQNDEDLHTFTQHGILPQKLCVRLPGSGVDLSIFTPCSKKDEEKTKRIFLMFGRVLPSKGYDLFLEAARKIKTKQKNLAGFWILGIRDMSRKGSIRLFEKILEYHKQEIIKYILPTDNVVPILHQSDIVVLPSQYNEGVPRCLLEALACGKPIITTNWKGCKETVVHGINGFLIERGDLVSLEKYIRFFIHADREILQKMGEASRQKAEKEFDEKFIISKYLIELQKRP